MDYRLTYTQKALNELAEIVSYIAEDNPEAAAHFGRSLLEHVALLTRFPRMGGTVKKRPQIRKLVHSPILIYYQINEESGFIQVLHLRHGTRKPPGSELRL